MQGLDHPSPVSRPTSLKFYPHQRHNSLHRLLHNFRLLMSHDDEPFTLITRRLCRTGLRYFHVGDQFPELALHDVPAVDRPDPPLALPTQESRAGRVSPFGRLELLVDHHARPGLHEIDVVST